jgi:hypothetical protein
MKKFKLVSGVNQGDPNLLKLIDVLVYLGVPVTISPHRDAEDKRLRLVSLTVYCHEDADFRSLSAAPEVAGLLSVYAS